MTDGLIFSPLSLRQYSEQKSSLLETATAPVRYLFKLYQIASQEREFQEIIIRPAQGRAHLNQGIVIREPEARMLTFQDLPVNIF